MLAGPLGLNSGLSPEVADAYTALWVTPRHWQTWLDEGKAMPESLAQAGAVKSFGALPLIVLSRGLDQDQDWQTRQTELLGLSSNSEQCLLRGADTTSNLTSRKRRSGPSTTWLSRLVNRHPRLDDETTLGARGRSKRPPSTMGCSSRRSSLAFGWCHWGITSRDVPQGARRGAHRWGRLLSRGFAHGFLAARLQPTVSRLHRDPVRNRGNRGWSSTCSSRGVQHFRSRPVSSPEIAATRVMVAPEVRVLVAGLEVSESRRATRRNSWRAWP